MTKRVRARRITSAGHGTEVVIYVEPADPDSICFFMPLTNAVTLMTDLRLAIVGEAVARKEGDVQKAG